MNEAHTDAQPTPLGTRIGGFLLQERLGAGGMAEVFLAARAGPEHTEFAALKRLLPHLTFDAEFVRMFLAEVKLTAELDHPAIAKVLDYGTGEGGHFFAMEYVHGHDVREVLGAVADRGCDLGFSLGVVADLADALHYAHEFRSADGTVHGLVHRDVSPSNVRIASDGAVKLIDFGIAHVSGHTRMTKAGTLKGKVGYMSPEQCRAETVDRRTDIFALGVMLYELTTGRRAFYGNSDLETLARIIQGQFTSPQAVKPELPTEIAALIVRTLDPNPNKRPATAAEISSALRNFASRRSLYIDPASRAAYLRHLFGAPSAPSLPPSAPTMHAHQPKTQLAPAMPEVATAGDATRPGSRRWAPTALIAALVLAVGVGGYWIGQRSNEAPTASEPSFSEPTVLAAPDRLRVVPEPEPEVSTPEPEPTAEPDPVPEPTAEPDPVPEPTLEEPAPVPEAPHEDTELEEPTLEDAELEEPTLEDAEREPKARPRPRKRPSKPNDAQTPSPSEPAGPTIDPDSLLAPSLR